MPPAAPQPPVPPAGAGGPFTLGAPAAERSWVGPTDDTVPGASAAAPPPQQATSYGEQRAGLFDAVPRSAEPPRVGAAAPQTPPSPAAPMPGTPPSLGGPGGASLPPNDQDTYPSTGAAPRRGGGRRTPVLVGAILLASLVVALAAFLLVRWLGDSDEAADGNPPAAPASTIAPSSVPQETTPAQDPAVQDPQGPTTQDPGVPAVAVSGVVHLSEQAPDDEQAPLDCASVGADHTVRVTADDGTDVGSVPLAGGSELGRTSTGGNVELHCEYRYQVDLPAGPSSFSFSLEASGAAEDVREVAIEELRSGTGPFLGTVYVPG